MRNPVNTLPFPSKIIRINGLLPKLKILFFFFQLLLVSSSKHADRWVVPGGGIEPCEEPRLAAVREALEEAGAKGHIGRFFGVFEVRCST